MFKKQDFKKLDLLGSGKKHTKIYKVQHIPSNKIYALKEIEAKNLEKLNEYKEEAVQLSKVQNVPNILKFYGYYFYETMYNTFRLGIVTEYMDHTWNLESLYRKRKKMNHYWTEEELRTFLFSLVATCSALQQKGICHRDVKPANLFMIPNGEAKLIDFGESKDYIYDMGDAEKETYTMATIRGTPQYLSPILWKAHVIDGNSRYAKHNIYKSDVFSAGLVVYQLASLKEVTGFNNRTPENDGEELMKRSLMELEKMYSREFVSIISLMLIFEEHQRPSFVEIEYLFMEQEAKENEIFHSHSKDSNEDTIKGQNDLIRYYNKYFNTFLKGRAENIDQNLTTTKTTSQIPLSINNSINISRVNTSFNKENILSRVSHKDIIDTFLDTNGKPTEAKLFWFEFGGRNIAKFIPQKNRWKYIDTQSAEAFPPHFSTIYCKPYDSFYLVGGPADDNFREFSVATLKINHRKNMNQLRNFAAVVYNQGRIYAFGGYDDVRKVQLKSCECYDFATDTWKSLSDMNLERSQATACVFDNDLIYVIGGYNKKSGALNTIEEYSISKNTFRLIEPTLPEGLRRFGARKHENGILLFGGVKQYFENSNSVLKVDFEERAVTEIGTLEKGGCVENEIFLDTENTFHMFFEELNGTTTPFHVRFSLLDKIIDFT